MSRDSAKAHYTKQAGDPDEGYITASDAQAAIDDIYDDMSAPAVIADGSVTSGKIAADAVGSAQIATGAVGSGELATDAVTSDKIADGAVSNAHVASDAAIAASKVAGTAVTQADTGTVTNGMLAGSIAKTKVAGTAITAADTGTVTGTMIGTGEVGNGNLAANAVNEAKIASGAVTTVKIADDAVTSDKIADNAVTAAQIAANAVGASELADNAVDTAAIAADAVTADKIANDTITAAELAAGSVGTSELADDSVTAAKILDGTITANEIQNASITGAKLVNDTITATQIAANAVGAPELADSAVDTAAIQDGAVTSAKIADGTIVDADINAAAAIAATKVAGTALVASTVDAKGDILTGTANDTVARLAAGADGTLLGYDSTTASGLNTFKVGNLLTANQASGTDTLGNTTGFSYEDATGASSTAEFVQGARSLLVTSTVGNGDFYVMFVASNLTIGKTYTFVASMMNATGTRNLRVYAGGFGGNTLINPTTWQQSRVTFVAVATSYTMYIASTGASGSIGDAFYADQIGLWEGAGGVWAMPGTPITGQGAIKANGAVELPGGGYAPEGVVTANPGSTFLQTSGAATATGMLSWRKATGTGNTGWVAEGALADTGGRNLAAQSMSNGWAVDDNVFTLRRIGSQVMLGLQMAKTSASGNVAYTLPSGFRPYSRTVSTPSVTESADDYVPVYVTSGGAITVEYANMTGTYVAIGMTWMTSDAWPASLPGVAA